MKLNFNCFRSLLLTLTLVLSTQLYAQEKILSFHSDISIATDASMEVVETIRVRSEGKQIRTGIYRDFPTDYKDRLGNNYRVGFEVLDVKRDGRSLNWDQEKSRNGVRVYLREEGVPIAPGDYSFELHYRTTRQLGFFADHDELYWNVTGNGWAFTIDEASARVSLPSLVSSSQLAMEGYTGPSGSQGQNYIASVNDSEGMIETSVGLGQREGLTLAFSFPKGVVVQPDALQQSEYLLRDNRGLIPLLFALFGSLAYLLYVWNKLGRDPKPGVIFPHYEAPKGYSPASARYIRNMGYDNLTFTAAIVNLAVKGHIKINTEHSKVGEVIKDLLHIDVGSTYVLQKVSATDNRSRDAALAPGESAIMSKLFADDDEVTLEQKNHRLLQKSISAHRRSLKQDYLGKYFKLNSAMLLPSLMGSIALLALAMVWFAPVFLLILSLILIIVMHIVFCYLLKAPSTSGRALLDKLEGFKDFLEVSEKDDLRVKHPKGLTPELFEKFLPYAIALNVEKAWADKFTQVFADLEARTGAAWHPLWYAGAFNYHHMQDFTKEVSSSINTAISAASAAPGTSSGAGGGGFSGGGGGGGGGGGC